MAGVMMQSLTDQAAQVRDRIALSSIVGADIKLRKMGGRDWTGICPFHAEKRDGAFTVNDDKQFYHCFACGAHGDVFDYLEKRKDMRFVDALKMLSADAGIDFSDAKQKAQFDRNRERREREALADAEQRRKNAQALWLTSPAGKGTPAQGYLEGRGIDFAKLGRWPGAIRYRHDCINGELQRKIPAMVTAIHALDGTFLAVHRTFLEYRAGGWQKARVERPKMVLGEYRGGVMSLWKGNSRASFGTMPAGQSLALSEGIEDALSVAMGAPELRVLAAVSIDNIGNVALPPKAGDLIVLAQRDGDVRELLARQSHAAGDAERAQHHERCARDIQRSLERAIAKQQEQAHAQASSRDVRIAWPTADFKDFNDELRGQRIPGAV